MQEDSTVLESRSALVVITPTPGRLRRGLLVTAGVAFGLFLFSGGIQLSLLALEEGVFSWLFGSLATSWLFWTLLAVLVLLLVLDSRSRRQVVWGSDAVRSSWLFGSLEVFVLERRHADLPTLELAPLRAAGTGAETGPWVLGWRYTDSRGRSDWLMQLARFKHREDAESLRQRALTWTPDPGKPERVAAVDELGSAIVTSVLRLPLVLLLSACVVMIAVAGESILMQSGRLPPPQPWDAQAEAELVRFAWRFYVAPREVHAAQGRIVQQQVKARLQAAVRFVDAQGQVRERPLALLGPSLPGGYRLPFDTEGGPAIRIGTHGEAGLVSERIAFEVPHAVLALASEPDGVLRSNEALTDPMADAMTPAYEAHWSVLSHIDRPGLHLPLSWTQPSLRSPLTVLYRERDDAQAPVWLPADLDAIRDELIHSNGFVYGLAFFAFVFGGVCLMVLAPRWLRAWAPLLWIGFAASSVLWTALTPTASAWLGIDHGLQTRVRDWLTHSLLPQAQPLEALDHSITAGHWSPQQSRFHSLLDQLDLLQPPPQRLPDLASARQAISAHVMARMQAMSLDQRHALLRSLGTVRLKQEGNDWLVDAALQPGLCRWLAEPDFAQLMRERYPAAVQSVECGRR